MDELRPESDLKCYHGVAGCEFRGWHSSSACGVDPSLSHESELPPTPPEGHCYGCHPDACATIDQLRAEIERRDDRDTTYFDALHRIASMPLEPRPDGSFNYDRGALVQIARVALGLEQFLGK